MNYDRVGTTDDVRGIVIGGDDGTRYKFYMTMPPGVEHYLGDGLFNSDTEAEAHCRAAYPDAYARGIEMRAFDQSPRPTSAPGSTPGERVQSRQARPDSPARWHSQHRAGGDK